MFDRTKEFRDINGITHLENDIKNIEISQFMKDINQLCEDIINIKKEVEEDEIRDINSIILGKDKDINEKKSNLTKKVHLCQNKISEIEEKINIEEKQEKKDLSYKKIIISSIYTLMGELTSQVQSKITKQLEIQYLKKQKFTTKLNDYNINKKSINNKFNSIKYNNINNNNQKLYDEDYNIDELSPEMEKVAQELANHLTNDIDALKESQNQLHEISNLMYFFSTKIQEQSDICNSILFNAQDAVENLDESKIHLEKFEENNHSKK